MKIIKSKEKGFEPFSIKIETEEEAMMLWHYLNINMGISLKDYNNEGYMVNVVEVDNFISVLWSEVNAIYCPKE
jgi:hypothetical protein